MDYVMKNVQKIHALLWIRTQSSKHHALVVAANFPPKQDPLSLVYICFNICNTRLKTLCIQ
jgi:hypothetical protein